MKDIEALNNCVIREPHAQVSAALNDTGYVCES